jgi:low temperature requirement protein LtrA
MTANDGDATDEDMRVLSVELFFDLVFVFTITQLTSLLVAEPTGAGIARAALIFGNVWWMYGGYAWLTNAVPPRDRLRRLYLLLGMAGFLIVALATPRAFGSSGVAFGVGYVVVTVVHTAMFLRASHEGAVRAMLRLGPYNTITAGLILGAGFSDGALRWSLWTAAFVLHWASPVATAVGNFRIRSAHFVERHGGIVLIALGESIIAVGIGVQEQRLDIGILSTSVLSLALSSALWWLYFDGDDERAEASLERAAAGRRPWLALLSVGYLFLPLLGGIVVMSAGVRRAVLHSGAPATTATGWYLAAGVSLYVASLAAMRAVLHTGRVLPRVLTSAVVLATVPAGLVVSAQLEIAILTILLWAHILAESLFFDRARP